MVLTDIFLFAWLGVNWSDAPLAQIDAAATNLTDASDTAAEDVDFSADHAVADIFTSVVRDHDLALLQLKPDVMEGAALEADFSAG